MRIVKLRQKEMVNAKEKRSARTERAVRGLDPLGDRFLLRSQFFVCRT